MEKYIIETCKIGLREIRENDFENWHMILSDQETMQYYPQPFDAEKTKSWIVWNQDNYKKYGLGLWAVILKETNEFIGDCGVTMQNIYKDGRLFPEIGFHISKNFWKKGFAFHAAGACMQYVFENTEFDELFCYQKWSNIPSRKTAVKIGMSFRKEYKDEKNGKTSVYSITKSEYVKQKNYYFTH